ncbi:serine/threonine-protein kinase Nek9-like [Sinocyclocheilus rhinocerous]|uniref:serine/threonine-protein kinase Nek9-like n=1 Tax=Sinocyclocheilus rhinocerous TaxID=307959 RepID=UPI0007B89CB2|nr:PREDICTED: serine/threonine-protein kinase Nek9-like [Sinocyclocheilus rhinocerous]
MLGRTVEADMDDRGLETPIFCMDSKTNESSCPSWLQKELLDAEFIPMPDDSQDSIEPLTKPYIESATLPYEELDQIKATATATGKSLMPAACVDYERMNGVETGRSEQSCCGASIELANLRETVNRQEAQVQLLQKQFNDQLKENERLWRAIQSLRADAGLQDISQNHRSALQEK